MSKSFDIEGYNQFLKKAYKMADVIYVDFGSIIENISDLSNGKFAQLCDGVIHIKVETDNNYPYTRLVLEKKYSIYEYLQKIDNWEDFSSMDEESEMSIWSIDFVKNDVSFATIVSHYRYYHDDFYFIEDHRSVAT